MAVLALAAGGALAGSALGGGVLTSIGWTAGALLGQMLFPSRPSGGPQLGDLTVQSSAYGTPIPLIYGTVRLAGNIIWSPGIKARRQRQRFGKGGGRSATTYRYSASLAVAFGEGPGRIVKLWFNDKLGYDATGGSLQIKVPGLRFRAYQGTETQQPDPLIAASAPGGVTTAYRGTIYAVFEGLDLEPFGNQIPNITALISTNVTAANTDEALNLVSGSYTTGWNFGDISTRRAYYQRATVELVEIDYLANTSRLVPNSDVLRQQYCCLPGGPIVGQAAGGGFNTRPVRAIDPISGALLWEFGAFSSALTQTSTGGIPSAGTRATGIEVIGPTRRRFALMESIGSAARPMPLLLDADIGAHVLGSEATGVVRVYEPRSGGRGHFVQGEQRPSETDAWHIGVATADQEIDLWRLRITDQARWLPVEAQTLGVTATLAGTVTAAMLGFTSAGAPTILTAAWDASDNSLIVFVSWPGTVLTTQRFAFKWSAASGVIWRTPGHTAEIPAQASSASGHLLVRERVAWIGGAGAGVVLNARTGEIEQAGTLANHGSISAPLCHFDGDYDLALSSNRRVLIGRVAPGTVPLSGIVQDIAKRAGLAASDLSLGALTDQVRGYVVGRMASARDAVEPLAAAFLFDLVETDGQMRGVKRGGAVTASLAYADLLRPQPAAGVVTEDRAQDRELPRVLTVRYLDVDRDYEPGAQSWQRPAAPIAVSGSDGRAAVDLAVPMTATEARTLARRLLMSAWRERNRVTFAGTPRHLRHDPADVLSVTRADGSTMRLRLTRADLGADYTMRFEAAEEDPADYALTATGVVGDYFQNGMPIPYVTRGFSPDLPLITDTDDLAGTQLREYLLAGGYGDDWRGAEVSQSDDLATWAALDPIVEGLRWGAAANALPAPGGVWTWDDANSLTVWMASGEPDAATDAEVLNWANLGALVTPATGALELIQWRDAVQNTDGSWTLSRLLRGRRGTEDGAANRAAGDLFLILDEDARLRLQSPASLLSATRYYRLRGLFDAPATATLVAKSSRGRAERPYAPVHITGSRDGGNNLTVTWVRRTRVGGELRDVSGVVPLAETSEAYEVEFLNGNTIVRTVTGLTAPTVSYSAANQTADGITPGDPVGVRVYQMSALVGRGIPGSRTV
jgi:hypothetical protein